MAKLSVTFNRPLLCPMGMVTRQGFCDPARGICLTVLGLAAVIGSSGCRRAPGLDVHPVSGTVTVDGAPLADGWITFRALEGDTRGCAGRIANGAYRVEAFAGPARVAVTASRAVPGEFVYGAPGTDPQPKLEHFIPRRYNEETELEADILRGGIKGLDFALTLDPDDVSAPATGR